MTSLPLISRFTNTRGAIAGLSLLTALLTGCATPKATGIIHGGAADQLTRVHTVAVLPAHITLKSLSAGGVSEKRDDWTEAARTHATTVLQNLRPGSTVYMPDLATRPDLADEIREVRALADLIEMNFVIFGMSPMGLPGRSFDFSVGSIGRILDAAEADALLVVTGVDEIFTADRKVMAAITIIASAALTGSAVAPSSGEAHVTASLIARDGTVLWWNFITDPAISDLRTAEGVSSTLGRLLEPLPATTPAPVMLPAAATAPTPSPAPEAMPAPEVQSAPAADPAPEATPVPAETPVVAEPATAAS